MASIRSLALVSFVSVVASSHSLALQKCVTDTQTGSTSKTSDCATCENLGGCCYNGAGDCGTPKPKLIAMNADFFDTGGGGGGGGTVVFDTFEFIFSFDLQISGLAGVELATELVGGDGPGEQPLVAYQLPLGPEKNGQLSLADAEGYPAWQQAIDLANGSWSVRVRTSAFPMGEIGAAVPFEPSFCPGDADGDGVVGFSDVNEVLSTLGTPWYRGDANFDGFVDFGDLTAVLATFGSVCD